MFTSCNAPLTGHLALAGRSLALELLTWQSVPSSGPRIVPEPLAPECATHRVLLEVRHEAVEPPSVPQVLADAVQRSGGPGGLPEDSRTLMKVPPFTVVSARMAAWALPANGDAEWALPRAPASRQYSFVVPPPPRTGAARRAAGPRRGRPISCRLPCQSKL